MNDEKLFPCNIILIFLRAESRPMKFIYNMESSYCNKFTRKKYIGVPNPKKYRGTVQEVLSYLLSLLRKDLQGDHSYV